MYLKPGEGREPMHDAAVRLLHCHGASLDPLKVLEVCALQHHAKCLSKMHDLVIVFSGHDCFVYGTEVGNFKQVSLGDICLLKYLVL